MTQSTALPEKTSLAYDEEAVRTASSSPKDALRDIQEATDHEVQMSLLQGIKLYPKAVAWSLFLSTAVIMEGFDTVLMNSFYAQPQFQRKFGSQNAAGDYYIPAAWQAGLSNAVRVGEIFGLFINGWSAERLGYRWTMIVSLVSLTAFVCLPFFAQNLGTLLAGQLTMGVPFGVFQTVTTVYASEVCPVQLRNYLTTYVNLCWVMGQLLGTGALRGVLHRSDEWAFRIPFALQWMWPVPLILGIYFAPESPWLLVRENRLSEASHSLQRLTTNADASFDAQKTIAMMVATTEHEKELVNGATYIDCFRGINLVRTEIVCLIWMAQALCGAAIMSWSTYFFRQAGLPVDQAFNMSLAQYGSGFVGTILSWLLMKYVGRRTLFVGGLAVLALCLVIIGFTGIAPKHEPTYWATGGMLVFFTFCYNCSVGPVVYSLVTELASVRLRQKTVALARIMFNVGAIINSVITPYMLNSEALNWGAKSGFFWAGICSCFLAWAFFRVPEPRSRTYGELDLLFENRVSPRKFSKMKVVVADQTVLRER
ncbi:MFS maltose permease MalP [Sarocladium strictum]